MNFFPLFSYMSLLSCPVAPYLSCGARDLQSQHANSQLRRVDSSPLTKDSNLGPLHWECSLSHWTTREVLICCLLQQKGLCRLD